MFSRSTTESILVAGTRRARVRGFVSAVVGLIMIMMMFGSSVWSATLFSDNFEAYPPGTDIAGQGGWYAFIPNQAPIIVSTGSGLGSLVLDGGIRTGDGSYTIQNEPVVLHSLSGPLSATGISNLSADAYAFSAYRSHAAGVYFSSADGSVLSGWNASWYGNPRGTPKWVFYTGSDTSIFSGGFDEPVKLEVIIDGSAGEAYGRLTHAAGTYETTHFSITPSQIASLTEVGILEDFRDSSYLGAEFDNISVSTDVSTGPDYRLPFEGLHSIYRGPGCQKHRGRKSEAIDYALANGETVVAAESGTVVYADWVDPANHQKGFGQIVQIQHPDGTVSFYAHLSRIDVARGDQVSKGVQIGLSGNSGNVPRKDGGYHLHFEIRQNTRERADHYHTKGDGISITELPGTVWNDPGDFCQGGSATGPAIGMGGEVLAPSDSSHYEFLIYTVPSNVNGATITATVTWASDWYLPPPLQHTSSFVNLVEVPYLGGFGCDFIRNYPQNNFVEFESGMDPTDPNAVKVGSIDVGPGKSVAIAGSDCFFGDNFTFHRLVKWTVELH